MTGTLRFFVLLHVPLTTAFNPLHAGTTKIAILPVQMPTFHEMRLSRAHSASISTRLDMTDASNDDPADQAKDKGALSKDPSSWSPQLRRIVASMASLGALETAYLTYTKFTGSSPALCGADGGCISVLAGPYAVIPFTGIPLAVLGLVAYSTVAILTLLPLMGDATTDDSENRIWLAAATTTMGTFSVFLMSLLFGVLHEPCPFCIASAGLSIGMAAIFWIGGGLPDRQRKKGVQIGAGSFLITTVAALTLFLSVDDPTVATRFAGSAGGSESETLLAESNRPPPITTPSSERTLALSAELQQLNAKMYGAYW
jgi:uncharacterized membrane protein